MKDLIDKLLSLGPVDLKTLTGCLVDANGEQAHKIAMCINREINFKMAKIKRDIEDFGLDPVTQKWYDEYKESIKELDL